MDIVIFTTPNAGRRATSWSSYAMWASSRMWWNI